MVVLEKVTFYQEGVSSSPSHAAQYKRVPPYPSPFTQKAHLEQHVFFVAFLDYRIISSSDTDIDTHALYTFFTCLTSHRSTALYELLASNYYTNIHNFSLLAANTR